jgi:hypothetical protein
LPEHERHPSDSPDDPPQHRQAEAQGGEGEGEAMKSKPITKTTKGWALMVLPGDCSIIKEPTFIGDPSGRTSIPGLYKTKRSAEAMVRWLDEFLSGQVNDSFKVARVEITVREVTP